jgi:arginyl-tRNA synthetase
MGYDTTREYYFNNAGRQMRVLGESVRARYLEPLGQPSTFPEDGYQGDYIREIAADLRGKHGDSLTGDGHDSVFRRAAEDGIFADIRRTLGRLGIASMSTRTRRCSTPTGKVDATLEALRAAGLRLREGRGGLAPVLGDRAGRRTACW